MTHSSERFDEWHVYARAVGAMAAITGLLYMRAIMSGGFLSTSVSDNVPWVAAFLVLLLVGVAGLLLAWRWEAVGGALAVAGGLAVAVLVAFSFADNRLLATLVYSSPFAIAGGLFLADWWHHRPAAN